MIDSSTIDRVEAVIQQAERELEAIAFELNTRDAEKLGALIDDISTNRADWCNDRRDDMTPTINVSETGQDTECMGCLYSSPAEAQAECVKAWLTGCGSNADADVLECLADNTDDELINELMNSGWRFPAGTDLDDAQRAVERARAELVDELSD